DVQNARGTVGPGADHPGAVGAEGRFVRAPLVEPDAEQPGALAEDQGQADALHPLRVRPVGFLPPHLGRDPQRFDEQRQRHGELPAVHEVHAGLDVQPDEAFLRLAPLGPRLGQGASQADLEGDDAARPPGAAPPPGPPAPPPPRPPPPTPPPPPAGAARTGSPARKRFKSSASSPAVVYRPWGSLRRHFWQTLTRSRGSRGWSRDG